MKLSYQLFKNADGTYRAEIPFPGRKGGMSIHQTGEKDRAKAERSAKYRCHRLPIEDRAHKKHAAKRQIERGTSGPGKPGRPRKLAAAPVPPAIDPTVTAAKLKALPIDSGVGPDEPASPPPVPITHPSGPAPDSPPAPPAEPLPPLPDAPPITPEIGDDRADDPDAEGNEFFADVIAGGIAVGTVRITSEWAKKRKPPKKAREPSPKCLEWYTEGLQFRLRALMGNSALTPNMKLLVGGAGVIVSMLWGAEDLDPSESTDRTQDREAPPDPPPPDSAARAEPENDQYEDPAPRAITNGHGSAAAGKFR